MQLQIIFVPKQKCIFPEIITALIISGGNNWIFHKKRITRLKPFFCVKDPKQDCIKIDGSDVNNWASIKSKEYLLSISRSLVIKLKLLLFYDKVFPLFLCLSATEVQSSKNNEGIQHS